MARMIIVMPVSQRIFQYGHSLGNKCFWSFDGSSSSCLLVLMLMLFGVLDLNPNNILISGFPGSTPVVKISDLGFSKFPRI
jgi:hypothetical protein